MIHMPFGRYRGCPLHGIESDYLKWVVEVAQQDWLREAVQEELHRRDEEVRPEEQEDRQRAWDAEEPWDREAFHRRRQQRQRSAEALGKGADPDEAQRIILRGYRARSMEVHPDRGGTHDGMIRLTATKDWLLTTIKRALK